MVWSYYGLRNHPVLLFFAVALILGLIFCFRLPPIGGNDEIVHFPRAYQISEGQWSVQQLGPNDYGGNVPVQIKVFNDSFREEVQARSADEGRVTLLKQQYAHERLIENGREPLAFTSAGIYSPWSYLPPAVGVRIARLLNLPIIWYMYLARIMGLLVWILLVCLAIRFIPIGKFFLVVLALLPTSLVQAATMGMDGLVSGLCWLIIALTFAIIARKLPVNPTTLTVLGFLSLYLATTKQGYAPLAALPLIIPSHLYPYAKRKAIYIRVGFAALLVILSIWYLTTSLSIIEILHFAQRPGLYVSTRAQMWHMLTHPISILLIFFTQPFTVSFAGIYAGFVGVITNRLLYLPVFVIILLYIGLVLASIQSTGSRALHKYRSLVRNSSIGIFLGSFLLISTALYLAFTRVGYHTVEGLQGRYFLPLAPLAVALRASASKPLLKLPTRYTAGLIAIVLLIGIISALITIG